MHAIGDMPDGNFTFRPAGEQGTKDTPAHLSVQTADSVHSAAAVKRQIGHVKGLKVIADTSAAKI
jgi:hypothetical protein